MNKERGAVNISIGDVLLAVIAVFVILIYAKIA